MLKLEQGVKPTKIYFSVVSVLVKTIHDIDPGNGARFTKLM